MNPKSMPLNDSCPYHPITTVISFGPKKCEALGSHMYEEMKPVFYPSVTQNKKAQLPMTNVCICLLLLANRIEDMVVVGFEVTLRSNVAAKC